jgi:hypothetical protein
MLTKICLISSVLFLVSCKQAPLSIPQCGLIKPESNPWYWYCQMTDDPKKEFTLSIDEPMVATTIEGYQEGKRYLKEQQDKLATCGN